MGVEDDLMYVRGILSGVVGFYGRRAVPPPPQPPPRAKIDKNYALPVGITLPLCLSHSADPYWVDCANQLLSGFQGDICYGKWIVAICDNNAIGAILYNFYNSHDIEYVYVLPNFRRKGCATYLVNVIKTEMQLPI